MAGTQAKRSERNTPWEQFVLTPAMGVPLLIIQFLGFHPNEIIKGTH